ncbi:Uncharacterised protein [Mycobacteroides abscessus]|nr:Uncharacterised protein [Mycobacteroides abscessus]
MTPTESTTSKEVWVPCMTRANTSRPASSWPKMCASDGAPPLTRGYVDPCPDGL